MFRVIVIDDEPVFLRSIKKIIESPGWGFQVIATATDGKSGLNLVKQMNPDLIMVDISMPLMDGMELITCLREEGNLVPAVIISGYQEFEFAKKAIQLGVLDYLVKPLNPLKIESFLNRLSGMLGKNKYDREQVYFEKIFHFSCIQESEIQVIESDCEFVLTKICFGAYNFFRNNQFASAYLGMNVNVIRELCTQCFSKEYEFWLVAGKYENEWILVNRAGNEVVNLLKKLYEDIKYYLPLTATVTFVSSHLPIKLCDLQNEFTSLELHLYQKSIFGKSSYISVNQEDTSGKEKVSNIDYGFIRVLAEKGKRSKLEDNLVRILKEYEKCNGKQAGLILILKEIFKLICPKETDYEIEFVLNLIIVNSPNYVTVVEKFMETVTQIMKLENEDYSQDASAEYMVIKVQKYLDNHFQEKVLIQEVANIFGFNYSYLCCLFKKYKRVSPNEYMIIKRMDMAKQLLKEQDELSVKEIADMVGYTDQYYFSRIFKTYEKVTPTEYRRK